MLSFKKNIIMKLDITRDIRAEMGIERWKYAGGIGSLVYVQRFGKTRVGCRVAARYISKNIGNVIIVVPNEVITKQWVLTINSYFDFSTYINRITVITVGKLFNNINKYKGELLILDEPQNYLTDDKIKLLHGTITNSKYILGLFGVEPSGERGVLLNKLLPTIDKISEEEAISKGWINRYKEYNIALKLTEVEKSKYSEYSKYIRMVLATFKGSADALNNNRSLNDKYLYTQLSRVFKDDYAVMQCCIRGASLTNASYIPKEVIQNIVAQSNLWKPELDLSIDFNKHIENIYSPNALFDQVIKFNDIQRKRNKIINNCENKVKTAIEIIKHFKDSKIISFSQSTAFANNLKDESSNDIKKDIVVYHSKLPSITKKDKDGNTILYKTGNRIEQPRVFGLTSQKKDALEGMKNGKYRVLSTVDSLNEGLNIPDLEVAIIASGDCSSMKDKQRKGRVKTIDIYKPDKLVYIINLYIDDFFDTENNLVYSRDLKKLTIRQSATNIIHIDSISEIN